MDRLLVLFPFELAVWRAAGVDVVAVGHPLADELPARDEEEPPARGPLRRTLALLPGSRPSELDRHLEVMLAAARELRARGLVDRVILPVAPTLDPSELGARLAGLAPELAVELVLAPGGDPGPRHAALAGAVLALVASGTATLEVALAGVPQVVVYRVNALTHWIARRLARVRHLALVNLIAEREVVPELLQSALTTSGLVRAAERLLAEPEARRDLRAAYREVRTRLGPAGAAERAADAVLEVLERSAAGGAGAGPRGAAPAVRAAKM